MTIENKINNYLNERGEAFFWEKDDILSIHQKKINVGSKKVNDIIKKNFTELFNGIEAVIEDTIKGIKDDTEKNVVINEVFSSIPDSTYNDWPSWYEKLYSKYSDADVILKGGVRPKGAKWSGKSMD